MMISTESPASQLRSDFELYKTQVAICAWCGVGVVLALVCAVIYIFVSIRKLRSEFSEKLKNVDPLRRFTISRPKYYPGFDPLKSPSVVSSPIPSPFLYEPRGLERSQSVLTNNLKYQNLNSPGPLANRNMNNGNLMSRRNDAFLNRNRQLYIHTKGEASPRPLNTPATGSNRNSSNFF